MRQLRERESIDPTNDQCSICGRPMIWVEGLLIDGSPEITVGRYGCPHCYTAVKPGESRAVTKGRELAHDLKGVHAMAKIITKMPTAVQIGILRERQHCSTCGNNLGDPCTCKGKCKCLYCQERETEC